MFILIVNLPVLSTNQSPKVFFLILHLTGWLRQASLYPFLNSLQVWYETVQQPLVSRILNFPVIALNPKFFATKFLFTNKV